MKQSTIIPKLIEDFNQKRNLDNRNLTKIINALEPFLKGKKKVLDLGCGSGRILVPLAFHFPKASFVGLDISREGLENISHLTSYYKLKNISLIENDFNKKTWDKVLSPKSFDCIFLFQSIHFIKNFKIAALKIKRLLKPGGFLVVGTTLHHHFYELPYCLAFPKVLEIELSRTPDTSQIEEVLQKVGLYLLKEVEIKIFKKFKNSIELKEWLEKYPYSALLLIESRDFQQGIVKFIKEYKAKKKILADEFSVLIFGESKSHP